MNRIETEQLEYWGDRFVANGLVRYMSFATFITNPHKYWLEIMHAEHRPLLRSQLGVQSRLDHACRGLEDAIEQLEAQVEHICRINNGHLFERMKHTTDRRRA